MNLTNIQTAIYNLFSKLRKDGLPLGVEQYKMFVEAFKNGYGTGILDTYNEKLFSCVEEELWNLMKTLWLIDKDRYEDIMRRNFEEFLIDMVTITTEESSVGDEENLEKGEKGLGKGESPEDKLNDNGQKPENIIIEKPFIPQIPTETIEEDVPCKRKTYERLTIDFIDSSEDGLPFETDLEEDYSNLFTFSNNYSPISERKMQRIWRYLKYTGNKTPSKSIDIKTTVEDWAKHDFFIDLKYKYERTFRNPIVFLIDKGESMAAFEDIPFLLFDTLKKSLKPNSGDYRHYFFRNYLNQTILPEKFLQYLTSDTLVFIISDAGAARQDDNTRKIKKSLESIQKIKQKTSNVFWLNPVPQKRWVGSSAFYLSSWVKMIQIDEIELQDFFKSLKLS